MMQAEGQKEVSVDSRSLGRDGYDVELRVPGKAPRLLRHTVISNEEATPRHVRVTLAAVEAKAYRDGYADCLAQVLRGLGL